MDFNMDELTEEMLHRILVEAEVPQFLVNAIQVDLPSNEIIWGIYQYAESSRRLNKQLNESMFLSKKRVDEAEQKYVNSAAAADKHRRESERLGHMIRSYELNNKQLQNVVNKQKETISILQERSDKSSSSYEKEKAARLLLKRRVDGLKNRSNKLTRSLKSTRTAAENLKADLAVQKSAAEDLRVELKTVRDNHVLLQKKLTATESLLANESKKLDTSLNNVEVLKSEISKRDSLLALERAQVCNLKSTLKNANEEIQNLKNEVAKREKTEKEKLKLQSVSDADLNKLKMELKTSRDQSDQLRKLCGDVRSELVESRARINSLQAELDLNKKELASSEFKITDLKSQLESSEAEIQKIKTQPCNCDTRIKYENLKKNWAAFENKHKVDIKRRDDAVAKMAKDLSDERKKTADAVAAAAQSASSESESQVPQKILETWLKIGAELNAKEAEIKLLNEDVVSKNTTIVQLEGEISSLREQIVASEEAKKEAVKVLNDKHFLLSEEVAQLKEDKKLADSIWLSRLASQNRNVKMPFRRMKLLEKSNKKLFREKQKLSSKLFRLRRTSAGGITIVALNKSILSGKDCIIKQLRAILSEKTIRVDELEKQLVTSKARLMDDKASQTSRQTSSLSSVSSSSSLSNMSISSSSSNTSINFDSASSNPILQGADTKTRISIALRRNALPKLNLNILTAPFLDDDSSGILSPSPSPRVEKGFKQRSWLPDNKTKFRQPNKLDN